MYLATVMTIIYSTLNFVEALKQKQKKQSLLRLCVY